MGGGEGRRWREEGRWTLANKRLNLPPFPPPLTAWLAAAALQRMVLVIAGSPEGDVLERWTFDVHTDAATKGGGPPPDKDEAEIVAEIQAIIRQVSLCVVWWWSAWVVGDGVRAWLRH